MYVNIRIYVLILEIISLSSATTSKANRLLENLCETLNDNDGIRFEEDKQWEIICRELFDTKHDKYDSLKRHQRDISNENSAPSSPLLSKAVGRGGSGIRTAIRTGTRGTSGGIRTGSGSNVRLPSTIRYTNTRNGQRLYRPNNNWLWARTSLVFLPLSTRYRTRSRPSSNRHTTPAANSKEYYYCTSEPDSSTEIQCESDSNDSNFCCEDENTHEVSCCGGEIPDYIKQDLNRATKTVEQIFYTLAVVALCLHLLMRRFHQ